MSRLAIYAFTVFVALAPARSHADECPGGSTSTVACVQERTALEKKLANAYTAREAKLKKQFGSGYGGLEGDGYLSEALSSFRVSNEAWRKYRDAECWYLALNDGMNLSPDYASVVSEACKVERTIERLKVYQP